MAWRYKRTEGGHKRGHSNMVHFDVTEFIKEATRIARRRESRELERRARIEEDYGA
jgi:hypothetical protein